MNRRSVVFSITVVIVAIIAIMIYNNVAPLVSSQIGNIQGPQQHSIAADTFSIPASEGENIKFTVPSGVTNAYVTGTLSITGGLISTINLSVTNDDTGATVISQTYTDQGNIAIYLPAGSYTLHLTNQAILAGEIHTVTATINALY